MEILIEIVLKVYLELMMWIVPEKNVTKKQQRAAEVIAAVVALGLLALVIWGVVLIADYGNPLGIVLIAVAVVLALVQICLGIVLRDKQNSWPDSADIADRPNEVKNGRKL